MTDSGIGRRYSMGWTRTFFASLAILIFTASAGAEEIDGFRGIKWGTDISALKAGFTKVNIFRGGPADVEAYKRASDELKVAGVEVDNISYMFRNGKLVSVAVDFRGLANFERLSAYCSKLYGPPLISVVKASKRMLSFESPETDAFLYLQISSMIYSDGRLFLTSRAHGNAGNVK
jgi:hypothetical protein